jgi:hypothetical protein
MLYFFCMGAPLVLLYLLVSFRSRVQPNWIVPAALPWFCLSLAYWRQRWSEGSRAIKFFLPSGLVVGALACVLLHDPYLVTKFSGRQIPPLWNPLRRLSGWPETAQLVDSARQKLKVEGRPVFIIGGHYGITSEISFYLPEAKTGVPDHPLAYYQFSKKPDNQFYFWPGYSDRKGQNAIYVQELDYDGPKPPPPPPEVIEQFDSVTDLGAFYVQFRDQPIRRIQLCECRGLR